MSSSSSSSSSNNTNNSNRVYVTTAINYTNGLPHIGHAYEAVIADCFARYHRRFGREVFFLTGTDEHGQKIAEKAKSEGLKPIDVVDRYAKAFQELNSKLTISNDDYIRTTQQRHIENAQKFWIESERNDDIYLGKYEGYYNVREENFITEFEAEKLNYKDPATGKPLEKMQEESYFFKISKYQKKLLEHIKNNPDFIQPEQSKQEILSRLKEDLRDLSISRCTFEWGIPVPKFDDRSSKNISNNNHVMYVWFDALSNYLTPLSIDKILKKNSASASSSSSSSSNLDQFWPANVQVIGKDIAWFHTVIWPCMLMSAGIPLPKVVFCHGFIVGSDGVKMSKSLGNVIDPHDYLKKYGVDPLRWFLIRESPQSTDLAWNEQSFIARNNSELANVFGNLVCRAISLTRKYCSGKITAYNQELFQFKNLSVEEDEKLLVERKKLYTNNKKTDAQDENGNSEQEKIIVSLPFDLNQLRNETERAIQSNDLNHASELVLQVIRETNIWITRQEPWKMRNESLFPLRSAVTRLCLEAVYAFTHFMQPFVPSGCEKVFNQINQAPIHISKLSASFDNLKIDSELKSGSLVLYKQLKLVVQPIQNVCLKVGKIIKIGKHPQAERLYLSQIDCGEDKPRQIVSGLVQHYSEDELLNKSVVVVANLKPAKIRGQVSHGMVLCVEGKLETTTTTDNDNKDTQKFVRILGVPQSAKPGDQIEASGLTQNSSAPTKLLNSKQWRKIQFKVKDNQAISYDAPLVIKNSNEKIFVDAPDNSKIA